MAVETISNYAAETYEELMDSSKWTLGQLRQEISDRVVMWAKDANTAIFQRGSEMAVVGQKRMGTTLAFVCVIADYAVLSHVGDSRIYRMRDDRLRQMTIDHVTRMKGPSRKNPGKLRIKKYVTKALGTMPTVDPDVRVELAEEGDLFLLCSDGLTDLVKEKEIERILRHVGSQTQLAVRKLIELANKRGGNDNITVVIGEVWEDDDDEDTNDLGEAMPSGSYF